jgi:glycine/D-amino acid oxidase-like deaminating enzyme
LRAAKAMGTRIYSPCHVTGVESTRGRVNVRTDDGPQISARRVVFATGYEVVQGVPRDAFEIVSSWAIATPPLDEALLWPTRCLIWEAADPYLYVRTTVDNRILAGGEDSGLTDPDRRAAAIPAKARKLVAKLRRLLGKADLTVDYAWAGAFAESPTGLPAFTALRNLPGTYAILGCGGNGITFSVIGAQHVKAWMSGRADKDADIFSVAST